MQVELAAKLFSGLADPVRLAIVVELGDGERAAGELAEAVGISASSASNHLRCLLECGLVTVRPQGRRNLYGLADSGVRAVIHDARRLLSRVGAQIEACANYGVSRRSLRAVLTEAAAPAPSVTN